MLVLIVSTSVGRRSTFTLGILKSSNHHFCHRPALQHSLHFFLALLGVRVSSPSGTASTFETSLLFNLSRIRSRHSAMISGFESRCQILFKSSGDRYAILFLSVSYEFCSDLMSLQPTMTGEVRNGTSTAVTVQYVSLSRC